HHAWRLRHGAPPDPPAGVAAGADLPARHRGDDADVPPRADRSPRLAAGDAEPHRRRPVRRARGPRRHHGRAGERGVAVDR
nr:hypothetical protein [Tanacetum cinerariifolium]